MSPTLFFKKVIREQLLNIYLLRNNNQKQVICYLLSVICYLLSVIGYRVIVLSCYRVIGYLLEMFDNNETIDVIAVPVSWITSIN